MVLFIRMDAILIKILATALALSQVMTRQDAIRTEFDTSKDRGAVVQLLKDGCKHMRRAFDIEEINLDELIETALSDPQAVASENKAFRGINFPDLHVLYREFCTNQTVDKSAADLDQVIAYYNKAVADLPDHTKLKGAKLPSRSIVLDSKGARFAEIYEPGHRRIWKSLQDISPLVQRAFIAAEDRRFFDHKGIDERAVVRAFIGNMGGQRQGGSTITQQLVKNLLVGDDVTYDRKMREMIVASRVERTLGKKRFSNSTSTRSTWAAARGASNGRAELLRQTRSQAGFGRSCLAGGFDQKALATTLPTSIRIALAAPRLCLESYEGGWRHLRGRHGESARARCLIFPLSMARNELGLHLLDHVGRELKVLVGQATGGSHVVRSTVLPDLQRAVELALKEGLARYEVSTGRVDYKGAEANLTEAMQRTEPEAAEARCDRRGKKH